MLRMNLFSVIVTSLLSLVLAACGGTRAPEPTADIKVVNRKLIEDAKKTIRTGDVILRSGKDFTSYHIRELSEKDKTYSHAGIAWVKDTFVYIYNICPPDIGEPAADTAMRFEPLQYFASPDKCFGFGIVRYNLSEKAIDSSIKFLDSLYRIKMPFDHYFDLTDNSHMYCSEMVDNALRYSTQNRIQLARKNFTRLQSIKAAKYFHAPVELVSKRAFIPIENIQFNKDGMIVHDYVFLK